MERASRVRPRRQHAVSFCTGVHHPSTGWLICSQTTKSQTFGRFFHTISTQVQSGAAGCVKCFVTCFLEVPLACLGSMVDAIQPNGLWNSQKHVTKPSEQVAAPDCRCHRLVGPTDHVSPSGSRNVVATPTRVPRSSASAMPAGFPGSGRRQRV